MSETLRNWAGHVTFGAAHVHAPRSVDEVRRIVREANRLRVYGTRHSFNAIADTPHHLLSLRHLPRRMEIDAAARTVTIDGGMTYAELCPALDAAGFALTNLPSVPDFTVMGAAVTATHGSGNANGNLASSVCAVEFVTSSGELLTLRRGDADFPGAVVNLGALGVAVSLRLDLVPRFDMRQHVFVDVSFDRMVDNFEALMGSAYSVSLFTRWLGGSIRGAWVKTLADAPPPGEAFFGGHPAEGPESPVAGADPEGTTPQLGLPGPWYDRLPHGRIGVLPLSGSELQSEYFVALADAPDALRALRAIEHRFAPLLIVSELRTVAADKLWLSMNESRPSLGIHFAFRHDWAAVSEVLPLIEAALSPFNPRPHWGKLFTLPATRIRAAYPHLGDFVALATRLDPAGKFRNAFLDEYVFGPT
jgi:xylitol oxidase